MLQFDKTGTGNLNASNLSHRYLWGPAVDQLLADEQLLPASGGSHDLYDAGNVVWPLARGHITELLTGREGLGNLRPWQDWRD